MKNDKEATTTIQIKKTTRDALKLYGTKGSTYDDVILGLIRIAKGK